MTNLFLSPDYKVASAGAFAGIVGTCLGYPLDVLKTRMQLSSNKSMLEAAKTIYINDNLSGFYRGISSPIVALTLLNTVNFSAFSSFKSYLSSFESNLLSGTSIVPISGALVGPIASMISTPFELIKTQMQLDLNNASRKNESRLFKNSFHAVTAIHFKHGFTILYLGHGVNTLREMLFLSTYFTSYEIAKKYCSDLFPSAISIPLAGGISGATGWLVSFPLDCIKSNIQGRNFENLSQTKSNFLTIGKQLLLEKGIKGLYSGLVPSLLRAFVVSSSRFSAYEGALSILGKLQ